jgi:hypothetical protein
VNDREQLLGNWILDGSSSISGLAEVVFCRSEKSASAMKLQSEIRVRGQTYAKGMAL